MTGNILGEDPSCWVPSCEEQGEPADVGLAPLRLCNDHRAVLSIGRALVRNPARYAPLEQDRDAFERFFDERVAMLEHEQHKEAWP